ncbi:HNH endonuclease signature motif containing protein [Oscillatoria sp. CS-180]|uniref:HNH endonuclease n=1 Tax=Oscillatoria sp. CS-180 TaxID=3021720 RepID=UPI00232B4C72|nr:HNH endonuclease signature motif containing protein [Oscillatoria sp. CS-180]MDB9525700.1 HNH endonuclease signature motif containing protein [Oscillatoria sp. CS-180]
MSISDALRQVIRERAKYICEYCHSPERLSANRFTVDHVIPRSLGGSDELDNLALACRRCNERRYNFVAGIDPKTQEIVRIFNPRQQNWGEHFVWLAQGVFIEGTTPVGRATCLRLDLNDTRYPEEDSIRETRRFWIKTGLHPPVEDPRQA